MSRYRIIGRVSFWIAAVLGFAAFAVPAVASCLAVAESPALRFSPRLIPAAFARIPQQEFQRLQPLRVAAPETIDLTYLGHSSFLLRTPENVAAITDYNGYIRGDSAPDIVTMNHAHDTHFTEMVEPGVSHVLRGWDTGEGVPRHNVMMRDMRVRNVSTNIRDAFAGTEFAGNSIFIFEAVGLCVAHLGHLHHQLEPEHIARIGIVDVLLAPIDDGLTMAQTGMVSVIEALRPSVVVPMHYNGPWLLETFTAMMRARGYAIREHDSSAIRLSRGDLPRKTVLVLPSGRF